MSLIVQKFGGTSVGSIERIKKVASRVLDSYQKGDQIVVVSSAMSGETNRLVQLAKDINPQPYSRDYDLVIASGEQVAIGLLSLAINTEALERGMIQEGGAIARPLLAYQVGFKTNSVYSKARIREIDADFLHAEIKKGIIPVIAGFQGVDPENNVTTLGRGGSDTSAVAIAAAIKADECEIYTDVDGVYTTDPRLYSGAKKIEKISFDEMMELASLGAKVLQIRSVELGAKYGVSIHVRSSFDNSEGTRVVSIDQMKKEMEQITVVGVAADQAQVKFTLHNLPKQVDSSSILFNALSGESVVVDVIVLDVSMAGTTNISFTLSESDAALARKVLNKLMAEKFKEARLIEEANLSKVSVVGVGMQHHPGVAAKMFHLLASAGIEIKLIATSEIKISCMIDGALTKKAVECLHKGFNLD